MGWDAAVLLFDSKNLESKNWENEVSSLIATAYCISLVALDGRKTSGRGLC